MAVSVLVTRSGVGEGDRGHPNTSVLKVTDARDLGTDGWERSIATKRRKSVTPSLFSFRRYSPPPIVRFKHPSNLCGESQAPLLLGEGEGL